MSHVDEGALHAYLDGALDEYPDAEARRIRSHLDHCLACVARLEEERAVRERAAAVLAAAEAPVVMPPLEELRRLARSGEPGRPVSVGRRYRIGWAASVMLALGTGWALRSTMPFTGMEDRGAPDMLTASEGPSVESSARLFAEPSDGPPAPVGASGATDDRAGADVAAIPLAGPAVGATSERDGVGTRSGRAAFGGARGPSDPGMAATVGPEPADRAGEAGGNTPAEAAARVAVGGRPEALAEERGPLPPGDLFTAAEPGAAKGTPAPPDSVVIRPEGESPRATLPRDQATPQATSGAPTVTVQGMAARADAAGADATSVSSGAGATLELRASTSGPPVGLGPVGVGPAGDAGDPLPARVDPEPGSLVVPGLEVVSIVWREEGVTPAGVRVLQRLDGEGMLELIHLPEGIDPASVEPPEVGVAQIVVPRENGWLVLRAPLDEAGLRELLRRLEAAP